eukprot:403356398
MQQQPFYDPNQPQYQQQQPPVYGQPQYYPPQPMAGQPVVYHQGAQPAHYDGHHDLEHHNTHDTAPHHNQKKIKAKPYRNRNFVFVILTLLIIIAITILSQRWFVSLAGGIFPSVNLWFLLMSKNSKISFLRCRVCVVYVWFGFEAFWQGVQLILLIVGGAFTAASGSGQGIAVFAIAFVLVLIQLCQGITYCQYVSVLTGKYWDKIHQNQGYSRAH